MYAEDFYDLWASGQDALPYLERLDIDIGVRASELTVMSFNIPATVIGKTRSFTFSTRGPYWYYERVERITKQLALPWAQLRDLEINQHVLLSWCITILQQMSLLEQCYLSVSVDEAAENMGHLTLSHLQSLRLSFVQYGDHIDPVIRHFTCPNLTLLNIVETSGYSRKTWDTIRKQNNLHHLQDLYFTLYQPFSKKLIHSSVIFRDAPMLRNIDVEQVFIMDEEICAGMATGAFGRFLRSLVVSCKHSDVGAVFGAVKDRQLAVAEMSRPGCSWQDEMASLKQLDLTYSAGTDSLETFDDEIIELERLGIAVTVYLENGI